MKMQIFQQFSYVFMQVMLLMLSMMIPIKSCDSGRLRPFLVQQRELCERADLDTTAEAAREVDLLQSVCGDGWCFIRTFQVLDDAIKKVMNSAEMGYNQEVPTWELDFCDDSPTSRAVVASRKLQLAMPGCQIDEDAARTQQVRVGHSNATL